MIEVVAAVIEFEEKLLAFQRGESKYEYISNKFEFPGGKVESGEDRKDALRRELREELRIEATIDSFIETIDHTYPDFGIRLHCYLVRIKKFEGNLFEHINYAHLNLPDAWSLDWVEADRPLLNTLSARFNHVFKS